MSTTTPSLELIESLYRSYNDRDLQGWLSHFAERTVWLNVPTGERYVGPRGNGTTTSLGARLSRGGGVRTLWCAVADNVVVAEFNSVGVHEGPLITPDGEVAPTHRSTSLAFCDVHTISGGKITETHRYWALAGAAAQLGL